MHLTLKRKTQNTILVYYIIFLPFLLSFLTGLLHLPSMIKYTIDIVNMFLFVTILFRKKKKLASSSRLLILWALAIFVYCFITYLIHYQSILYFLWGVRNNFRYYVFFAACVFYLYKKNIEECFKILNLLFYINAFVVCIQFLVLHYYQDNLGGIFGVSAGCNGWLNIFLVIMTTYYVISFLNKKLNIWICILNGGLSIGIAAIAELKFFFLEFIIIVLVGILITDFSFRKFILIAATAFGIVLGVELLLTAFPVWKEFLSWEGIWEIVSSSEGYTGNGDMNRMTVFSLSNKYVLTTADTRLFGLGLGNCDHSDAFHFLTTPFYRKYHLLHYDWLSSACWYLETGVFGFILFETFYVLNAIFCLHQLKTISEKSYIQLTFILSIMCILISLYNSSLRIESAYMMYFMMSLPHIINKEEIAK